MPPIDPSGVTAPAPKNIRVKFPSALPPTEGKFLYHLVKLQFEGRLDRVPKPSMAKSGQDGNEPENNLLLANEIGGLAITFQTHKWDEEGSETYITGPKNSPGYHGYAAFGFVSDPLTIKLAFEILTLGEPQYDSRILRDEFIVNFLGTSAFALQRIHRTKDHINRSLTYLAKHYYITLPTDQAGDYIIRQARLGYERQYLSRIYERLFPSSGVATNNSPVECIYRGNDCTAMSYILSKYKGQPKIISIRDTHIRTKTLTGNISQVPIRTFLEDFKDFLCDSPEGTQPALFVFGGLVDREYIRAIRSAAKGQEQKLGCFQCRGIWPLMNFLILDYSDGTTEVFFGWGQRDVLKAVEEVGGRVFSSTNQEMVKHFRELYVTLIKGAEPISILSDSLTNPTITADVPKHALAQSITGRWKYTVERTDRTFSHCGECKISYFDGGNVIKGERRWRAVGDREYDEAVGIWSTDWCQICVDEELRFTYHIRISGEKPGQDRIINGMCDVRIKDGRMEGEYYLLPPFDSDSEAIKNGYITFERMSDVDVVEPPDDYTLVRRARDKPVVRHP